MRNAETVKKLSAGDDLFEAYLWVSTELNIGKQPKKRASHDD